MRIKRQRTPTRSGFLRVAFEIRNILTSTLYEITRLQLNDAFLTKHYKMLFAFILRSAEQAVGTAF